MSSSQPTPPLLALPLELRLQIYTLILPHTTTFSVRLPHSLDPPAPSPLSLTSMRQKTDTSAWKTLRRPPRADRETGNDIVWRRGSTSLLCVNKQVHDEAADMLYGTNVFVVDVSFAATSFRYRWRTANDLTPKQSLRFMSHFSARNLLRIRRYVVNVESVDDYTGMIKYNVGGRGLPAGIRGRVAELVELLGAAREVLRLELHLIDGEVSRVRFASGRVHRVVDEEVGGERQGVLEPFGDLRGVRGVKVTGVREEYARELEGRMSARREVLQDK